MRNVLIISGVLVAMIAAGALIVNQTLDDANKWASIVSMFAAIVGLGVAVKGIRTGSDAQSGSAASPRRQVHRSKYNIRSSFVGKMSIGDSYVDRRPPPTTEGFDNTDPGPDGEGHR